MRWCRVTHGDFQPIALGGSQQMFSTCVLNIHAISHGHCPKFNRMTEKYIFTVMVQQPPPGSFNGDIVIILIGPLRVLLATQQKWNSTSTWRQRAIFASAGMGQCCVRIDIAHGKECFRYTQQALYQSIFIRVRCTEYLQG